MINNYMSTETFYLETSFPIEDFKDSLLNEYESKKSEASIYQFTESVVWPSHTNYYLLKENIPVAQSVADKFKELYGIECLPRYYVLNKGFILDVHRDDGTQASFNYLLSDDNDPLEFYVNDVKTDLIYKKGLLNLQVPHAVPESKNTRILLKLSIYGHTFDECKQKIEEYENSNIR